MTFMSMIVFILLNAYFCITNKSSLLHVYRIKLRLCLAHATHFWISVASDLTKHIKKGKKRCQKAQPFFPPISDVLCVSSCSCVSLGVSGIQEWSERRKNYQMHRMINLLCCHSRFHHHGSNVENLSCQLQKNQSEVLNPDPIHLSNMQLGFFAV